MTDSLLKESPLLVALDKERTVYDGFISVQEKDFRLRISLPPDHQLKQAKLHCCWKLKQLLKNYQDIVKQRLHHSSDLVSFILELRTILEVALKSQPGWLSIPPPQYYSQLITEIEDLGWDKLLFIDTDFHTLQLSAEDSSGRQHAITVKLKAQGDYPAEAPECSADLPVPLAITWTPQSTLAHIHSQFLLIVEALAEFWAVLDEIDEHTWVLEPEKPTRADCMRRIAIGNSVSIKLEIDPRHPKMLPECCLLGAEHVVTPLRNKLNANMHLWNPDCSVLQNMKDVMEIEFPSPATHEKSSFSVECGICYAYRLDSAIPDQVCNDPRCGQPFHQACLYEWLRGLPTSRQSFNVVFGECPYCNKPITVKMAIQKP
ncbi:E3 ubiquitin-protein ligase FANCL [Colossoma macropomum]|uniref:E3 ubiquitin-protein ligase FANCL n=1 Tax=Colossoma macropomum TaxID=42526 RepID=UPI0018655151|nr:E3 ubiquitin-protein ligase FANCL [Colossoma macropomum]